MFLEDNIGDVEPDPKLTQPRLLFLIVSISEDLYKAERDKYVLDALPGFTFELRYFVVRCGPWAVPFCEHASSLPLKPQKLSSSAVPCVEAPPLPCFCCFELGLWTLQLVLPQRCYCYRSGQPDFTQPLYTQSQFCRLFSYTQKSPLSQTAMSYLTDLFLVQPLSLPLIFCPAFP